MLEFQNQNKVVQKFKLVKKKFGPKIKPMIENLQNELYQLENKQAKGAKHYTATGTSKRFSECLKNRICKFKQHLNYIVMIINQNILRTFLKLQKNL